MSAAERQIDGVGKSAGNVRVHRLDGPPGGEVAARVCTALLAIAAGLVFWGWGAKYSLDGWVIGLNLLSDHLRLPVVVPYPQGWWNLLFIPLGIAYSYIEVRVRPRKADHLQVIIGITLLVILTHATDLGSTYLAITTPPPGAWAISQFIADQPALAGAQTGLLTYGPELLMLAAWRLLRAPR